MSNTTESAFNDAEELLKYSKSQLTVGQLVGIKDLYKQSLGKKSIDPKLLIGIKNLLENIRSTLDYTAYGLYIKYGHSTKRDPMIYFPYAKESQTLSDFRKNKVIEWRIPGLRARRPDIASKIESYQHFSNKKNIWLPQFMELVNTKKHRQLKVQERRERKKLKLTSRGTSMEMGEGASISMGSGTTIKMRDMVIPGGQKFDVDNPPVTSGSGVVEVIVWESFLFSAIGQQVLPFLEQCIKGVEQIVEELSEL